MALVDWNDSYRVEIATFDTQHKQLFNLLNQLHEAMIMGQGQSAMGDVLTALVNYTATHFADEERLLKQHNYPDFEEHIKEHRAFVQQVLEFQQKFVAGNASITLSILSFLRDWVQKHINVNDKKYSSYLRSMGVS